MKFKNRIIYNNYKTNRMIYNVERRASRLTDIGTRVVLKVDTPILS